MNGLRITLAAGVAAALACTSFAAHADEQSGLSVGARVGYAIPYGDAQSTVNGNTTTTTSMGSFQRGMLPVWFDVGYRFNPHVYLGVFYQFAPTFPPSGGNGSTGCFIPPSSQLASGASGEVTCDGFEQRFGLNLHYHIRPKEFVDPWVGIGVGVEMSQLNYSQGASGDTGSFQAWGPQADLQLGVDLRFSHVIPIGPFVDMSVAQFGTENTYNPNNSGSPLAFNTTLHGWITLGVRVQFNL